MKKIFCMLTLVLGSSVAHAQVYFEPGSTRPINPGAATHEVARQHRTYAPTVVRKVVRCRGGSRHALRACRRHARLVRR